MFYDANITATSYFLSVNFVSGQRLDKIPGGQRWLPARHEIP
ncbi:hypothetical protein CLOSTASPAR_00038 [[Clostridium] asparagiforme DSM 15981]|uniref:Uncharacterized protein n=1 Tax=[Clostridium] asparagiforme DSM 15981 TaxID=518636 RepID=C0CSU4_9FIRM|nr:hypothetical protein CLOSTASPAR_00038 [[Clostridium] asparagiforme DSM 15981]